MSRAGVLRAVVALAREKRATANAASIAFYGFNVLVALLVFGYASVTLLGSGTGFAGALSVLTGVGVVELRELFEELGSTGAGRWRAIALAGFISAWSSLRLFRGIESVFSDVYGVRSERALHRRLLDSLLVLAAVTAVVVVMAAAGSLFVFRTTGVAWVVLGPIVLWVALFVLYLPLYYRFSAPGVSVAEVAPGTALAAAGWTVSAIGLRAYLAVSESVDLFGLVGAVLLVLTWLYVVGLSIVLGAILNARLAGRIDAESDWYVAEEP